MRRGCASRQVPAAAAAGQAAGRSVWVLHGAATAGQGGLAWMLPCQIYGLTLPCHWLQMVNVTRDMNAAFGSLGREALASSGQLTPTLARELKEMRRDPLLAALLARSGAGGSTGSKSRKSGGGKGGKSGEDVQPPARGPDGNYSWGSGAMPWEIAATGQQFIQRHVRMQDVLSYIR